FRGFYFSHGSVAEKFRATVQKKMRAKNFFSVPLSVLLRGENRCFNVRLPFGKRRDDMRFSGLHFRA
ncbi:MAG TPA: hypothetical protein VHB73_00265, partial [Alphaproteobacteria bacterium]|nr:hypothetical protein [Alphaproteobacteria bacterium]